MQRIDLKKKKQKKMLNRKKYKFKLKAIKTTKFNRYMTLYVQASPNPPVPRPVIHETDRNYTLLCFAVLSVQLRSMDG